MKRIITSLFALMLVFSINAQDEMTIEQLQAAYDVKSGEAAALQAEADALKGKMDAFPGWKIGGLGILGFNMFDNSAWYTIAEPFSSQNSIGLGFTAFANLDQEKIFWRNALTTNMTQTNSKSNNDSESVESISDKLGITSLAGYKLTPKIAISAEAAYNSTVLNFNDPGQLTMSAGATWLPIKDMVVVIHPLGYQFNFPSSDYTSSAGAKIGVTYTRELLKGVSWNTSLNSFLAYGGGANTFVAGAEDYTAGQLSNWVWENGIGLSVFKGIGVGLNFGLAGNRQLVDGFRAGDTYDIAADPKSDSVNPIQSYYNLGLSYGF